MKCYNHNYIICVRVYDEKKDIMHTSAMHYHTDDMINNQEKSEELLNAIYSKFSKEYKTGKNKIEIISINKL